MSKILKAIIIGPERTYVPSLLKYKSTIGADFLTKKVELKDGTVVTQQIWDTAGKEKFQSLGTVFYRGADACILVFDITQPDSLIALDKLRNDFIEQTTSGKSKQFPFIVVGNKSDLDADRKVSTDEAKDWCRSKGMFTYIETSCKNYTNIDQLFYKIIEMVYAPPQKWWERANNCVDH